MDCPVCRNTKLVMAERQGIEIDYCPDCRGVWLDRGELDKMIDGAARGAKSAATPGNYQNQPSQQYGFGHSQQSSPFHKKKREGFLSDLFDFD